MKRYIAITAVAAMLSMPVHSADWWVPSPISVTITVGQWLMKDRQEVYYVQVRSTGRDETHAREQAFRLAVEQAIGALVLAETEVRNGNVDRDDIISYSSGFVHDFTILERRSVQGGQEIVIDVWVARSHLANRLLSTSKDAASVEGGRISQQIESFQHSRGSADRVLSTVLSDFPNRAFQVRVGKTQVLVDEYRKPMLSIWVDMAWDENFLRSLDEAVARTSHAPQCDSWLQRQNNQCQSKIRARVLETTGYYDDRLVGQIIQKNMVDDPPRLQIKILDTAGTLVHRMCVVPLGIDPHEYYSYYLYTASANGLNIQSGRTRSGDVRVALDRLPTRNLDRVEAAMVRKSRCFD
jgi:hypothetical protein